MRRLLISIGLAAAVGGTVLGAAATLDIAPTTLGAGATVVATCDPDGVTARLYPYPVFSTPGIETWSVVFSNVADACLDRPADVTLTKDGVLLATADYQYWYTGPADANYLYGVFNDWPWSNAVDVNDLHLLIK